MSKIEPQSLLVIGVDTVSVANSAKKAGYKIYTVDYFGDLDLRQVCMKYKSIIQQKTGKSCGKIEERFNPKIFLRMTKDLLKNTEIDAILLSSGLDDYLDVLNELNDLIPILGNHPRTIEKVREKQTFFKELKRLGIPYPETAFVRTVKEAKVVAAEIGYPVVMKPSTGFGGTNVRMAKNSSELELLFQNIYSEHDEILIQKFIRGKHASLSLIASSKNVVRTLTINEQLLGLPYVFQSEPFGYCGNIVPLTLPPSTLKKCKYIAQKLTLHFKLVGSNGIDFVISRENIPYVMEVNPRFQGTLECVEHVLSVNLVKSHVDACIYGTLPTIKRTPHFFCTRLILYSPMRIIAPDLTSFVEVRDIPLLNTIIEKNEPLCSVIATGDNRQTCLSKAKKVAQKIYGLLPST